MRVVSGFLTCLLLLTAIPCFAANEDGSAVAVLDGGRTLVPIRSVTEWLGATVRWSPRDGTIAISRANTVIHLRPGSNAALLNGDAVVLDSPPLVLGGVTYLPARFVAESFGAIPAYEGRTLTLTNPTGGRPMQLRVAVRRGNWITYRGPWFDIDYPASFRPLGHDAAVGPGAYNQDSMRFTSPDGAVEFYVHSPLWSGQSAWARPMRGETVFESHTSTEGSGPTRKEFTWVTVAGLTDDYMRSWVEVHQPDLNVRYHLGVRYDTLTAYDRWKPEYEAFRKSLVQYAD